MESDDAQPSLIACQDPDAYHENIVLGRVPVRTRDERLQFLKRYLDLLPDDELAQVPNLASKAKKRRTRSHRKKQLGQEAGATLSAPMSTTVSVQVTPVTGITTTSGLGGWFRKFKRSNTFAMDVEKVEVPTKPGSRRKFDLLAAKVTLVNTAEEVVYQAIIKRKKNSFRTTPYSFAVNGISPGSLENGIELATVQEELKKIVGDGLVVGVDLVCDFNSLDIPMSNLETFDLQWHFYRVDDGVLSKLGLRSLCKYFFKIDMQRDGIFHSDEVDAIWTIRLFRDVYTKITPQPTTLYNCSPSNEIVHFKRLWASYSN